MYRCAQCVSTYTAQHDHISSREHAWLKSAQLRIARIGLSKTVCHPRVMSHSLPHLTPTTSTSSLSPASSIFQSFSPLQSCPLVLDPLKPCDDSRRSGGSTEIPSPTQSAVKFKRVHISTAIHDTDRSWCSERTAGGTVSTVGVVSWVTQHHPREVALVPHPFLAQAFSFQGHFELSRLCCWSCSQHFSMSVPSGPKTQAVRKTQASYSQQCASTDKTSHMRATAFCFKLL